MRAAIPNALDATLSRLPDRADDHDLSSPLPQLLASGGDHRLKLDPKTHLNGYGCRPYPRPEAFTFASSTATSISERAFLRAQCAQHDLVHAAKKYGVAYALDQRAEQMRHQLKAELCLGDDVDVAFSPSGTDTQLHAMWVAQCVLGPRFTSVIAAADETGSGTAYVSEGRHFADVTAQGVPVEKGVYLREFEDTPARIPVSLRDENGGLRDEGAVDRDIIESVASVVADGGRVLLHAMDRSKCGFRSPSFACLEEITSRWPESVLVLTDACQMRLARARLADYLNSGFLVAITGSKFFTGPPFSGALLIPKRVSQMLGGHRIARGLGDYTNRSDWPKHMWNIRRQLPDRHNPGQWLRWEAALEELRAFFAVPLASRHDMLERFANFVLGRISRSPCSCLLPVTTEPVLEPDREFPTRTIFPFTLHRRGLVLGRDECARVYKLLNEDVSHLLPGNASPRERAIAAQPCHIGQPVALRQADGTEIGALRVSAGARVVSESWLAGEERWRDKFASELREVETIFDKIELMLAHSMFAPHEVVKALR